MNKYFSLFIFLLCTVCFSSCKIQAPTFKNVQNLKLERAGLTGFKAGGEAVFNNPNFIRLKITDVALDVLIDNKLVGILGEKSDILIKRKSDFTVPFGLTLKPEGTIFDNIKNVIGMVTGKSAELAVIGKIKVKWLCFKREVPIRFKHNFKLSDVQQTK